MIVRVVLKKVQVFSSFSISIADRVLSSEPLTMKQNAYRIDIIKKVKSVENEPVEMKIIC